MYQPIVIQEKKTALRRDFAGLNNSEKILVRDDMMKAEI